MEYLDDLPLRATVVRAEQGSRRALAVFIDGHRLTADDGQNLLQAIVLHVVIPAWNAPIVRGRGPTRQHLVPHEVGYGWHGHGIELAPDQRRRNEALCEGGQPAVVFVDLALLEILNGLMQSGSAVVEVEHAR